MLIAFGEASAILAGGTDLLVKMKSRELQPQKIISITNVNEINRIRFDKHTTTIGACCTIAQLSESDLIQDRYPALVYSANQLGSPAVRNLGTIGGNVATASPAADLPPALIAYGAEARLVKNDQERFIALETLFRGPGSTWIGKDEILTDLCIENPNEYSGAAFFKLGHRKALQCAIINGACYIALDPKSGTIENARIALGAVAPTVVRATSAEKLLRGEKADDELFIEASRAATLECNPIDDVRGSGAYRRDMVQVLTNRTLHKALENARLKNSRV